MRSIKINLTKTICVLMLFSFYSSQAIDLSKVEFSYLYKNSHLTMTHQLAQKDNNYLLIINFHLNKVTENDMIQNFQLTSQKKFTTGRETAIVPISQHINVDGSITSYHIEFEVDPEHSYLVVMLSFLNSPYVFDIPIKTALSFPLPDFSFKTEQLGQFEFKEGDSLAFSKMGTRGSKYFVYTYNDHFTPSTPPMSEDYPDANKKFVIASINEIHYGFNLAKTNYLHYIQSDTTTKMGVSIYCHTSTYPEAKTVDELIPPLIYISTERENKKLSVSKDKKAAFDDFWLNILPNQKLAARTIRNYYRGVKRANELFTDYKEGWKTDRGMIYIIYGAPTQVFKKEDMEIWEYNSYDGRYRFIFDKIPNLFVQHHFTLRRERSYTKVWFDQIEKWRKGNS